MGVCPNVQTELRLCAVERAPRGTDGAGQEESLLAPGPELAWEFVPTTGDPSGGACASSKGEGRVAASSTIQTPAGCPRAGALLHPLSWGAMQAPRSTGQSPHHPPLPPAPWPLRKLPSASLPLLLPAPRPRPPRVPPEAQMGPKPTPEQHIITTITTIKADQPGMALCVGEVHTRQ